MYFSLFDGNKLDFVKNMESVHACAQAIMAWAETERTISKEHRTNDLKFLSDWDFYPFSHEKFITEGWGASKEKIAQKYKITMIT